MGSEWTSMSAENKAIYMARSVQEKERYCSELRTYQQGIRKKRRQSKFFLK